MSQASSLRSTSVATLHSGFCSLFILFCTTLTAQTKHTESVQQTWLGYFNQTRFNNKWGLWADLHLRSKEDFVNNLSQSLVRLGLTYYLHDDVKLTPVMPGSIISLRKIIRTFHNRNIVPGNKYNGIPAILNCD